MIWGSQYFLSEKYARWIILSLSGFFICLIFLQLLHLILGPRIAPLAALERKTVPVTSEQTYQHAILEAALFGQYVPVRVGAVKQSNLDLKIVGILFAKDPHASQVVIRAVNGEERIYTVGDALPGGAKITRIVAEGILILHDGQFERLSLDKNDLHFDMAPKPLIRD